MSRLELPEDWVKGLLEQAVTVKSGVGFPHKFQGKLTGDFPVYKVGDLSKAVLENDGYLCRAGNYVNTDEISQLKGEVFPKGSTLFAKIGEAVKLNRRAYVEVEGLADNNVMSVVPVIEQSKRFIYYFLKTVDLTDVSRSTTVPSIRKGDIEQLPIHWPSLAEQKVIADKLDTLLAQVESIKARLERISEILKQFRQSVLAAAVSGKLTEGWRKQNGISQPDKKKIRNIINALDQGWSPKCLNEPAGEGEWGVIKTSSIQAGFFVRAENKKLPKTLSPRNELTINKGDLLITRAGPRSRCGVTCIVDDDHPNLMICDKVYRIRVNQSEILPNFLNWCLNSPQYLLVIDSMKTGISESGMNITQQKLLELELLIPQLIEQVKVFQFVERLFNYADSIDRQIHSALDRVNNLTQSILAKAFRGELTAEWRKANPELISGENSAEAFLERIKAERTSVKSATKCGRAKT